MKPLIRVKAPLLLLLLLFSTSFSFTQQFSEIEQLDVQTRGSGFTGRHFISSTFFEELPEEQKQTLLSRPDYYFIEGISKQVITNYHLSTLPASRQGVFTSQPDKYELVDTDPTIAVSEVDLNRMTHEERVHILINLDRYKIVPDTGFIGDQPSGMTTFTQGQFDSFPEERQNYILNNPQSFQIITE
jgi:hypothetical protein